MSLISLSPLKFVWDTADPFLFCVHHNDAYPAGNELMGPSASLHGRNIGQDFEGIDGWRMYHGKQIPGFPQHPHRGFETVTLVRRGFIDHSDSLGATARFGQGDAQWLTAGRGIVHAEMFPLRERNTGNPLELFQIWLNLPASQKMVAPYFSMFWNEQIPERILRDTGGKLTRVVLVAGSLEGTTAPPPPPNSYAAQPQSELAIWTLNLEGGAQFTLPPSSPGVNRSLYWFEGDGLKVGEVKIPHHARLQLHPDVPTPLTAGPSGAELLLLQGRPIGEPVAQYGPFVMNTQREIQQAFADYQATRFGGWPWKEDGPVHPREEGRFARHPDGRILRPPVDSP